MTKRGRTIIGLALMALGGLWMLNGVAVLLALLIEGWPSIVIDTTEAAGISATAGTITETLFTFIFALAGLLPLWFGYRLWKNRSTDTPLFGRNEE